MNVDEVSENHEDIEEQNLISYDRQEKEDKQNFIDMFKNKHSYLNANTIADSKILSWKRIKIYAVYELYSLYREFSEDKRKSRSLSEKLSKNYIDCLDKELQSNSNLKNN